MRLDDTVKKHIPELQNDFGATVEDLLRYRVNGPRMSKIGLQTFEQLRTYILETGFSGPPGESSYANVPAFILGIVLERVGGTSLAVLGHTYFFEPLGMEHTTYFPSVGDCAPTEIQNGNVIQGVVHDESSRLFSLKRRSVAHAGLFSTAGDLLLFLEALIEGKFPAILDGAQKGLGWTKDAPWLMGSRVSNGAFGKTGFTGTSILVDPEKSTALVILSNRTYPTRPADAISTDSAMNHFRRNIAEIVFA